MIIGKITEESPESKILLNILGKILDLLKKTNFDALENKKYKIFKDKIYLIISEYETKKPEEKDAEQHKIYIDLHYVISGKEAIGIGYDDPENKILADYNLSTDSKSFRTVKDEIFSSIKEKMYIILFPGEIHRPGLNCDGEQMVRKAVVKINSDLLHQTKDWKLMLKNLGGN